MTFDESDSGVIELESTNGKVNVALPSDTKASINASTVRGDIINDFGLHASNGLTGSEMRGKLGDGGATIKLTSLNGAIEIHRVRDGKPKSSAQEENDGNGI